jgi:type III secretory pathway component EscR
MNSNKKTYSLTWRYYMEETNLEEKQIVEIDNIKYTVISRKAKEVFSKDKLVRLIAKYALSELQKDY